MGISIKTADEIKKMRTAGQLTKQVLDLLETKVAPGITTLELDKTANAYITENGGVPSFLGYNGFPASICASVNSEVIHGIPGMKKLRSGDIVSIDVGVIADGYHGDAARTFLCGECSEEAIKLVRVTEQSFFEGMKLARHNNHLFFVSKAIQAYAEANGFSVVRDYCGHGIGSELHEDPSVPNYKPSGRGPRLIRGMTLAIEPMINAGTHEIKVLPDKWTVTTKDGKLSAHYENTVLITDGEPEILTL